MKTAVKKTARQIAQDWNAAHAIGMEAVAAIQDRIPAMVVTDRFGGECVVADGVCGFAWLEIRPARGPIVTFLKKNGIGYINRYEGCYQVSIHAFNQSLAKKEAYATAAADYLRSCGYEVYSGSRID